MLEYIYWYISIIAKMIPRVETQVSSLSELCIDYKSLRKATN